MALPYRLNCSLPGPWPAVAERRLWTLHRQEPCERGYCAFNGLVLRHGPHGRCSGRTGRRRNGKSLPTKKGSKKAMLLIANHPRLVFSIGFYLLSGALNHTDMLSFPLRCRYAFPASSDASRIRGHSWLTFIASVSLRC